MALTGDTPRRSQQESRQSIPVPESNPRESLSIRGPALPSVVNHRLTADGKAGPRMKKTILLDTLHSGRLGFRMSLRNAVGYSAE